MCGWRSCVTISNVDAPIQMAKAIASPPTIVMPGYFASIEAELEVEPRDAERANAVQPARLAALVLIALGAAELEACLPPRRGGRHSGPDEIVRAHLDVEAELLPHLGVECLGPACAGPERPDSRDEACNHHPSCGVAASDRAMAAARWFQLAVSSPRRRRPAAVSR